MLDLPDRFNGTGGSHPFSSLKPFAMGGVATGPGERVVFPGVLVILNQGPSTPPSTGGTVGTVVNHIGFTVPNV